MGVREIRYCDLTGTEPAAPHEINIDQLRVEIDLCPDEYERLLKVLGPYMDAGRVEASVRNLRSVSGGRSRGAALNPDERVQFKAWAAESGIELPPNGRFKKVLVDQWRAEVAPSAPAPD